MKANVFWFRRDLRLNDNAGLDHAAAAGLPVLPLFIFDSDILDALEKRADRRVDFIHQAVSSLARTITQQNGTLLVFYGRPTDIFERLLINFEVSVVYANHDYEPYARERDQAVRAVLSSAGAELKTFKDQCIFEKDEVVKADGKPYTVFTPYMNSWLRKFESTSTMTKKAGALQWLSVPSRGVPSLADIGFMKTAIKLKLPSLIEEKISRYADERDFPSRDVTTRIGIHLRFGTVSIRDLVKQASKSPAFLSELIWREFFMMILWHYPQVVTRSFKERYDRIRWRNDPQEFRAWCEGRTGYPLVDAGMRELNESGFMHNRVRMVTASFLCKHLLVDWRWGEAYFASRLDDYELSSNNGNWQWAAGTGCDAAPYFRIFNPETQLKRFDPGKIYVRKWISEFGSASYPHPIVDHQTARTRALEAYKAGVLGHFT